MGLGFYFYQVPMTFSEGGCVGRGQDKFLSLGMKMTLKAEELQVNQKHEVMERKWEYYHIIIFPEQN